MSSPASTLRYEEADPQAIPPLLYHRACLRCGTRATLETPQAIVAQRPLLVPRGMRIAKGGAVGRGGPAITICLRCLKPENDLTLLVTTLAIELAPTAVLDWPSYVAAPGKTLQGYVVIVRLKSGRYWLPMVPGMFPFAGNWTRTKGLLTRLKHEPPDPSDPVDEVRHIGLSKPGLVDAGMFRVPVKA